MSTLPPPVRVVIRDMAADRGPGDVIAIIDNAYNVGASEYFNSAGEAHFTLPTNDEQAGLIEPWQTHYVVQEWLSSRGIYATRFTGLITDFDANENDVVFYGTDYYGLLAKVVDSRYVEGEPDRSATADPPGSKYVDQYISTIIRHLLLYAQDKANSPVGFISLGKTDTFAEKITLHTTFMDVRTAIEGLVESHRQGTGKNSRFWVQRVNDTSYRFRLADNVGRDRPALRMEFGGLVQGFQIIGMGNFAVKAHGIGRTQTGFELFYKQATAPGISQSAWGGIETVEFFDNVADANDLLRRVKQKASTESRVGKRVALGIRVDELGPFDGYSIGDAIPLNIKRGVVDTNRYGSGLWSIYGVEWRVEPDGHAETSLIVSPKEDSSAPDADLLASSEVVPSSPVTGVRLEDGAVTTPKLADDAVEPAKLADGAVTNPKLADAAVGDTKIIDGAVAREKIANDAVDDTKIQDGSITTPLFDAAAKAPLSGEADHAADADTATLALQAALAEAVENSTAEVIVDATGLTVLNGKIALLDHAGESVLTAAGFKGPWLDFLSGGLYNHSFRYGVVGPLVEDFAVWPASATGVGNANLPYWYAGQLFDTTVELTAAGAVQVTADGSATAAAGGIGQYNAPVVAGERYSLTILYDWSGNGGGRSKVAAQIHFFDADNNPLDSLYTESDDLLVDPVPGELFALRVMSLLVAPEDAVSARVLVQATWPDGASAGAEIRFYEVSLARRTEYVADLQVEGSVVFPDDTTALIRREGDGLLVDPYMDAHVAVPEDSGTPQPELLYKQQHLQPMSSVSISSSDLTFGDAGDANFHVQYPGNLLMTGKKVVIRAWLEVMNSFNAVGEFNVSLLSDVIADNHNSGRMAFSRQRADTAGLGSVWWPTSLESTGVFDADTVVDFYAAIRATGPTQWTPYGHASATYVSRIGYQVIGYY